MPRPRKTASYDAPAEVINKFFDEMKAAAVEQKAASGIITDLNSKMEAAGVHPGVLSAVRKIEQMPAGKRGYFHFLLRRYLDIREPQLRDPEFQPAEKAKPEGAPVPFERQTAA